MVLAEVNRPVLQTADIQGAERCSALDAGGFGVNGDHVGLLQGDSDLRLLAVQTGRVSNHKMLCSDKRLRPYLGFFEQISWRRAASHPVSTRGCQPVIHSCELPKSHQCSSTPARFRGSPEIRRVFSLGSIHRFSTSVHKKNFFSLMHHTGPVRAQFEQKNKGLQSQRYLIGPQDPGPPEAHAEIYLAAYGRALLAILDMS